MKTLNILFISISVFIFSSCEELLNDFNTDIESDYMTFEITAFPTEAGEKTFTRELDHFNFDSIVEAQGVSASNISSVTLTETILEIDNKGESRNFDSFESLEAYTINEELGENLIADYLDIPEGKETLEMNIITTDVTEFTKYSSYTLKLKGVMDKDLTDTLIIKGKLKYLISVSLFE